MSISETCAHLLKWDGIRGLDSEIFSGSLSTVCNTACTPSSLESGWGVFCWTRTEVSLKAFYGPSHPKVRMSRHHPEPGKPGQVGMTGAFLCSRSGMGAGAWCATGLWAWSGRGKGALRPWESLGHLWEAGPRPGAPLGRRARSQEPGDATPAAPMT